jgi:hypothetical protein
MWIVIDRLNNQEFGPFQTEEAALAYIAKVYEQEGGEPESFVMKLHAKELLSPEEF